MRVVKYHGFTPNNPLNEVTYAVYGGRIVFTAMHSIRDGPMQSTINAAESIVAAIIEQERISDPEWIRFYDLQTGKGYPGSHRRPGEFTFNKLKLSWESGVKQPTRVSWTEIHCSEDVLNDFKYYIWGNEPKDAGRNMAVAHGAIPACAPIPKIITEIN